MKKLNYHRYEVSSFARHHKYESAHNLAYWKSHDWIGLGLGACGYENHQYYECVGTIEQWSKKYQDRQITDDYFQVMMMGLRLHTGIDLSINFNYRAYQYFKDKLCNCYIKDNHLRVKNLNLLDDTLVNLI
jgi:oxygen-independent coproporphyrinogen-3 oxidase